MRCASEMLSALSEVPARRYKYKAFGTVFGTYTGAAQVNSHPEDSSQHRLSLFRLHAHM